jgi:hypothetical protein
VGRSSRASGGELTAEHTQHVLRGKACCSPS